MAHCDSHSKAAVLYESELHVQLGKKTRELDACMGRVSELERENELLKTQIMDLKATLTRTAEKQVLEDHFHKNTVRQETGQVLISKLVSEIAEERQQSVELINDSLKKLLEAMTPTFYDIEQNSNNILSLAQRERSFGTAASYLIRGLNLREKMEPPRMSPIEEKDDDYEAFVLSMIKTNGGR